jgi:hypothetical protein
VRQILCHQVDLARSLRLEQLCLAHDVVQRKRPVAAPHQRNRAEGAAVITPLADLEVAYMRKVAGVHAHPRMRQNRGMAE